MVNLYLSNHIIRLVFILKTAGYLILFVNLIYSTIFGTKINMLNHTEAELDQIRKYIPENAEIIQIAEKNFLKVQIDSSREELIAAFKDPNIKNAVFLEIICGNNQVFRLKGDGTDISSVEAVDVVGNGNKEILMGTNIGNDINRLNVFSFDGSKFSKEFTYSYSKYELISENKNSEKAVFAFWLKNRGGFYDIDIVRWNGSELVPVSTLYKRYYPKVVDYYKQAAKTEGNNAYVWYGLADAQIKAGFKKDALISIGNGVALNQPFPTKQQFDELKRKIK